MCFLKEILRKSLINLPGARSPPSQNPSPLVRARAAEQAGLASDIAAYLPSRDAWLKLRQYATAQHLTIDNTFIPDAWATAVEQAQPGQLAEGTIAVTIEGTRHREGLWNNETATSEHAVAFTLFVVCGPTYETCHLLRLSQLDNPLR